MPSRPAWQSTSGLHDRQIPPYNAIFDPSCNFAHTPQFQARLLSPLMATGLPRSRSQQSLPSWAPLELPSLEQVALAAIDEREAKLSLIYNLLEQGLDNLPPEPTKQAKALAKLRGELAEELQKLRLAGVEVIEAVVRWRRRRCRRLEPFVWRSHNYLLKMLLDVFFLGLNETVAEAVHDPFLLTCFEGPTVPPRAGGPSLSTADLGGGATGEGGGGAAEYYREEEEEEGGGDAAADDAALRRRQQALAMFYTPSRRHTKHEMVRMWAAERILEAERLECGEAFAPQSPAPNPRDAVIRRNAALLFFGTGEPPELMRHAPTLPRLAMAASSSNKPTLMYVKPDIDPAVKPPPPRRAERNKGGPPGNGKEGQRHAASSGASATSPAGTNPMGTLAPLTPPVTASASRKQMTGGRQLPGLTPPPFVPRTDGLKALGGGR